MSGSRLQRFLKQRRKIGLDTSVFIFQIEENPLKTPDALQGATALAEQATGFISNDPAFQRVADLEVIILDDLLTTEKKI